MKILLVHNYHLAYGGSDIKYDLTVQLMKRRGHHVITYTRHNNEIVGLGKKLSASYTGIYSSTSNRELSVLIEQQKPDVVHCFNLYPLISPSILYVCSRLKTPVVYSLCDFTLICPTSHHYRSGALCELCKGGNEYRSVLVNCKGNIFRSAAYGLRAIYNRMTGVFTENVSLYIAPSEFVKRKYTESGFEAKKLVIVPNMVRTRKVEAKPSQGEYVVYHGRLSPEKGIEVLLEANKIAKLPLRIAGEKSKDLQLDSKLDVNTTYVGRLDTTAEIEDLLKGARFSVTPSIAMEAFGNSVAEAMSAGLPTIVSEAGALPELVKDKERGYVVTTGSVTKLAEKMMELWSDRESLDRLGAAASAWANSEYTADRYVEKLEHSYNQVI